MHVLKALRAVSRVRSVRCYHERVVDHCKR